MRGLFRVCALAAVISAPVLPALAEGEAATVIHPTTPWQLDAGDEKCRLARLYGAAPQGHLLFIEQDQPGSFVNFAIAGPTLEKVDWREPVTLRFGEIAPIHVKRYAQGVVGEYEPAILVSPRTLSGDEDRSDDLELDEKGGLPRIPTERFTEVDGLTVEQDGEILLTLAVPTLAAALDALNACGENFVPFWGLDLDRHRDMKSRVKWINRDRVIKRIVAQYPTEALRRGEQGTIRFMVIIDEEGEVTECRQSGVTEVNKLKSPVCREMRSARFEPARDINGAAMKSYYASTIRYVLP